MNKSMIAVLRKVRWLLLLLCAAPLAVQAATYAFSSDTYALETAANTVTWDQTCTSYPRDDDKATVNFTGGFTFTFAGVAYPSVRILSNGGLQFGADTGFFRTYTNTALPAGVPVAGGAGSKKASRRTATLSCRGKTYRNILRPGFIHSRSFCMRTVSLNINTVRATPPARAPRSGCRSAPQITHSIPTTIPTAPTAPPSAGLFLPARPPK